MASLSKSVHQILVTPSGNFSKNSVILRTSAKRKSDVQRKKDSSKSNGKKVYYARLLSVSVKYRTYARTIGIEGL